MFSHIIFLSKRFDNFKISQTHTQKLVLHTVCLTHFYPYKITHLTIAKHVGSGASAQTKLESLYTQSLDNLSKSSILYPNWTHLLNTVSLWEIHANFHIIVKPIKSIHNIWKDNTITIPNVVMSVSVYRVGKKSYRV